MIDLIRDSLGRRRVAACAVLAALLLAISLAVPGGAYATGPGGPATCPMQTGVAYAEVIEQQGEAADGATQASAGAEEIIEDEDVPLARATSVSNGLQPAIFASIIAAAALYRILTGKIDRSVSYMRNRFN